LIEFCRPVQEVLRQAVLRQVVLLQVDQQDHLTSWTASQLSVREIAFGTLVVVAYRLADYQDGYLRPYFGTRLSIPAAAVAAEFAAAAGVVGRWDLGHVLDLS
jgi:hypothetical protein